MSIPTLRRANFRFASNFWGNFRNPFTGIAFRNALPRDSSRGETDNPGGLFSSTP
jgi:hypothetical protein